MTTRCIIRNLLLASASLAVLTLPSISRADTIIGGVIDWTATDPLFVASTLYPVYSGTPVGGFGPGQESYLTAATAAGYGSDPGAWVPTGLTYTGTLDLTNNQVVIQADNQTDARAAYQNILNMVASGYNNGAWTGTGITSTFAAANVSGANLVVNGVGLNPTNIKKPITGIALALNDGTGVNGSGYVPYDPHLTSFDGVTVNSDSILMAFTYYGDDVFQGAVSSADISDTLAGFALDYPGTVNGDFDYLTSTSSADISNTLASFALQGQEAYVPQVPSLSNPAVAFGGPVGVPEPGTGSMAFLGIVGLAAFLLKRRSNTLGSVRMFGVVGR